MSNANRWDGERTAISFPPRETELYRKARMKAQAEGKTFSRMVRYLLREYIGQEGAHKPSHPPARSG